MIQERQDGGSVERYDLFTDLLESNSSDAGPNVLDDRELIGTHLLPLSVYLGVFIMGVS